MNNFIINGVQVSEEQFNRIKKFANFLTKELTTAIFRL